MIVLQMSTGNQNYSITPLTRCRPASRPLFTRQQSFPFPFICTFTPNHIPVPFAHLKSFYNFLQRFTLLLSSFHIDTPYYRSRQSNKNRQKPKSRANLTRLL